MQLAPLQLENLVFGEVHLKHSEGNAFSDEGKVDVATSYKRHVSDPKRWVVELNVSFKGTEQKAVPYHGKVDVVGFFVVTADGMKEEDQQSMVAVNGPSILYSSVRVLVSLISGLGTHGKFLLPGVSFYDQRILVDESKEVKEPKAQPSTPHSK